MDVMGYFCGGAHGSDRGFLIPPRIGGNALGQGLPRPAAVRGGAHNPPGGNVIGYAHKCAVECLAVAVRIAVDLVVIEIGHPHGDGIHIVVIVAELGAVQGQGLQILISRPVGVQGFAECLHGDGLLLKDQTFYNRQGIGDTAQSDSRHHRPYIVEAAAPGQILPGDEAVLVQGVEEGAGDHLLVKALGLHSGDGGVADDIGQLPEVRFLHPLIRGEFYSRLFGKPHKLPGHPLPALVQSAFQGGAEI